MTNESKNTFKHAGVVSKINDSTITVNLEDNTHCEGCRAKSSCGMAEASTKQIEIESSKDNFKINEAVQVILSKSLGLKAILWAYVFPFILMFLTLAICVQFINELSAGLLSLAVLIPYYSILYLLKSKLKSTFQISILKLS